MISNLEKERKNNVNASFVLRNGFEETSTMES